MRKVVYVAAGILIAVMLYIIAPEIGPSAIILTFFGLLIYFLPAFIATAKKKQNSTAITILNLFLGWTILGWIIALVWAATVDIHPTGKQ